ncbi:MAG: RNA methyltransferase [Actinomycetota bacterium]|jgi:TrmH family RNA methyltransferase|nr:RNA methyltransferase [Rubrobacter sp.]MDQ3508825.1 RNA methyltransferase [Actinomycetota bacterium]
MPDKPELPGNPPFSIKRAAKLAAKKHREIERLFLAEGAAIIGEANVSPRYVFEEPEQIKRISSLSTSTGSVGVFPFVDVPAEELLSGRRGGSDGGREPENREPENREPENRELRFANPRFASERSGAIVLLHGIQDPGNVGAVIRSAYAFGAGVALSAGCADLYNPKTVRGTMGAIFHTPVSREVDSLEFLRAARKNGFFSVAAMPEGGSSVREIPEIKLVVVVGSEGAGLPGEVVEACDGRVTIPSEAPSLNAAIAASILLYEAHSRVLT